MAADRIVKESEFDARVAKHVRVWGAASLRLLDGRRHHFVPVLSLHRHSLRVERKRKKIGRFIKFREWGEKEKKRWREHVQAKAIPQIRVVSS